MQTGLDIKDLVAKLLEDDKLNRDFLVNTNQIDVNPTENGIEFVFTTDKNDTITCVADKHASRQIATHIEIPAKYWDKMLTAPELLAHNVSHWFEAEPALRMLRTKINGTAKLRAYLSQRYRIIDHVDVAQVILPIMAEPGWSIAAAQVTDLRLYIQAVSTEVTGEIKPGDILRAGVTIANSEVGAGSLCISPMIYSVARETAIIAGTALSKNHVGRALIAEDGAEEYFTDETRKLDDLAFASKISDVVRAAVSQARFEELLSKLRQASQTPISADPMKAIEITAAHIGLDEQERGSVLRNLIMGADLSVYGIAQAVAKAADDAVDYDRAVELQRLSGDVVTTSLAAIKSEFFSSKSAA